MNAEPTNWGLIRQFGQRLTNVLMFRLAPEELRRLRGPALKRSAQTKAHPLFHQDEQLRILLAPDLQSEDETVRLLAELASVEDVRVFADSELINRLSVPRLEPWHVNSSRGVVLGRWGAQPDEQEMLVSMEPRIMPGPALRVMGNDVGAFTGPVILRYAQALAFQMAEPGATHLMATRVKGAILERLERAATATAGLVSPEEALLIALIVRHARGHHLVTAKNGFIATVDPFGWYSGLAQMALPRYLPLFSAIARELEARGEASSKVFDCFEGIFKRIRQLLRIHDHLGYLQLVESFRGTNNSLKEEQGDLVFNAVSGVQSALDGFVVMLANRANVPFKPPSVSKNVSFGALNRSAFPWRDQFGKYQPVADICKEPVADVLALALSLRRLGFHYHPLLSVGLSFNEWITVERAGEQSIHPIREETAGAIRFGEAEWSSIQTPYGVDGLLPAGDDLYVLPWGFVRALLRETVNLMRRLLDKLAEIDGVSEGQEQATFSMASPYARFMLRWDQLALGVAGSLGLPVDEE